MSTVNTLVIGGGGGGATGHPGSPTSGGGGGGAGQITINATFTVTPQAYSITVGNGGGSDADGTSSVFSTITSIGGSGAVGRIGGTSGNGYVGGNNTGHSAIGGGGAGSTSNGGDYTNGSGGGTGINSSISGASLSYAGGGGGGADSGNAGAGSGTAGGGNGGGAGHVIGHDATANTGSGGGGGAASGSFAGGSGATGIVVISFPTNGSTGVSTTSSGGTITTLGGNQIHTFTTSGTWTMVSSTRSISVTVGMFVLTGIAVGFHRTYILTAIVSDFVLTGYSVGFVFNGDYNFSVNVGTFILTGYKVTFTEASFTSLLSGIFSLMVSPALTGEVASGLVMEAQNSYGLNPIHGSQTTGILIDNSNNTSGIDSYYSVWSDGAVPNGGIDFNDSTLWQNFEPVIETDIIPIGTILNIRALGNIQFKLDRPMSSGDQIELAWRPSLTDNYIVMGTTSTAVLSDYYKSNIENAQWVQFRIRFKCAANGSSRIPLREIRIQLT